jgi:hypothetical protein
MGHHQSARVTSNSRLQRIPNQSNENSTTTMARSRKRVENMLQSNEMSYHEAETLYIRIYLPKVR